MLISISVANGNAICFVDIWSPWWSKCAAIVSCIRKPRCKLNVQYQSILKEERILSREAEREWRIMSRGQPYSDLWWVSLNMCLCLLQLTKGVSAVSQWAQFIYRTSHSGEVQMVILYMLKWCSNYQRPSQHRTVSLYPRLWTGWCLFTLTSTKQSIALSLLSASCKYMWVIMWWLQIFWTSSLNMFCLFPLTSVYW